MIDDCDSNEALNTLSVNEILVNPETNTDVRLHDKIQDSTTANIKVTINFVGVLIHNRSTATLKVNADICTARVESQVSRNHRLRILLKNEVEERHSVEVN